MKAAPDGETTLDVNIEREIAVLLVFSGNVARDTKSCRFLNQRIDEVTIGVRSGSVSAAEMAWELLVEVINQNLETEVRSPGGRQLLPFAAARELLALEPDLTDELLDREQLTGKRPLKTVKTRQDLAEAARVSMPPMRLEHLGVRSVLALIAGGWMSRTPAQISRQGDGATSVIAPELWKKMNELLADEEIVREVSQSILNRHDSDHGGGIPSKLEAGDAGTTAVGLGKDSIVSNLLEAGPSNAEDRAEKAGNGLTHADSLNRGGPVVLWNSIREALTTFWGAENRRRWMFLIAGMVVMGGLFGVLVPEIRSLNTLAAQIPSPASPSPTSVPLPSTGASTWVAGWGPDRAVFKLDSGGSSYPTFNSISDNPNIGDERNFVGLKRADPGSPDRWQNDVWGKPGDTYWMRVYVNNSGKDSFGTVMAGWIQGAKLQVGISKNENSTAVYAKLTANNAATVWDGATIHVDPGVDVRIDTADIRLNNNAHPGDGLRLDATSVLGSGIPLGYDQMDGNIQPGYKYDSYVVVKLVVE